jgi:putative ABC transport system permease protein
MVLRQLAFQPARPALAVLAIVAATAALIWVVSGYDRLVSQFDENARKYLGEYDLLVAPAVMPDIHAVLSARIIEQLQRDPAVLEINPLVQSRVSVTAKPPIKEFATALDILVGSNPPVIGAPPADPILVGTNASEPPYELVSGEWFDSDDQASQIAVISKGAALQVGVEVGDEVLVTSVANQITLRIVGIVSQPTDAPTVAPPLAIDNKADDALQDKMNQTPSGPDIPSAFVEGIATSALYVRWPVAELINGYASEASVAQIALRDGFSAQEFKENWDGRFRQNRPPLWMIDFTSVRTGLEQSYSVETQRSQAYAATGMAALAAGFIIFATLSMGVTERARELAVLRSIALSRKQVAGMIFCDSFCLGLLGWLGGMIMGVVLLKCFSPDHENTFQLGLSCLVLSGLSILVACALAASWPMWRAIRTAPLDGISQQLPPSSDKSSYASLGLGLLLTALAPLTVFWLSLNDAWRLWIYAFVSYPCLVLGMILITPSVMSCIKQLVGKVAARWMRLDEQLLRSQLSSNRWRTIGAALALSLGLALYASTQIWGHSMLQPFLPGSWAPEVLVAFHPLGMDDQGLEHLRGTAGIAKGTMMPLMVEQAEFDWSKQSRPERLRHNNAILMGINPQQALGDSKPLLQLDFVQGNRGDARHRLQAGGSCLIAEDFHVLTGINVGDQLTFISPQNRDVRPTYEVAGIVALPGWQWMTKFSGVRRHSVRTGAMIFVNAGDVRRDFQLDRTEFCWMNLGPGVSPTEIEPALQKIAELDAQSTFHATGHGQVTAYRPFARVTATNDVHQGISMVANEVIWELSRLPLVTLAIMSLAILTTMVASVRVRRWEFGVLRAIGISRSQIVRLILVETFLIGLVACVMSLAFGIMAGWCGIGMALYSGGFFGGPPTLVIPWANLAMGFGFAMLLCLVAGVMPAVRSGFTEPIELLRAGRNSI